MKLDAGMVYDIILLISVLFMIWRGWHQGLVSELVRIAGWLGALLLVTRYVPGWAERLYGSVIEPQAVKAVAKAIPPDVLNAMESGAVAIESLQEILNSLTGFFGGQVVDQTTANQIIEMFRQDAGSLAQIITTTILQPVLMMVVQVGLSLLILGACMLVSRLLAKLVAARRHDGVGSMTNRLLGSVLGFGEGLVTAYIYVFVLSLLAVFFSNGILSQEILQSTRLVKLFL